MGTTTKKTCVSALGAQLRSIVWRQNDAEVLIRDDRSTKWWIGELSEMMIESKWIDNGAEPLAKNQRGQKMQSRENRDLSPLGIPETQQWAPIGLKMSASRDGK